MLESHFQDAGGYSFLAHRSPYYKGEKLQLEALETWNDYGISSIGCFSLCLKNEVNTNYYIKFCKEK